MDEEEIESSEPAPQSEANAAQPETSAPQPEAAPTDLRRNIWLLIIVLAVIIIAWAISLASPPERGQPRQAAPPQDYQNARAAPEPAVAPQQQQRSLPVAKPAPLFQVAGGGGSYMLAAPDRALQPGGPLYRKACMFDVTQLAQGVALEDIVRMQGRYAAQAPVFHVEELPEASFQPASQVEGLSADDIVVAVTVGDTVRAYPLSVVRSYIGLSDRIGGRPVFLCWNTFVQRASALIAATGGKDLQFRDAGVMYRGHNVYYDVETGSLWDPASGLALTGPLAGHSVEALPVSLLTWAGLKEAHPDSLTLVSESLHATDGKLDRLYADSPLIPFPLRHFEPATGELPAKEFVLGVFIDGQARAYPLSRLYQGQPGRISDTVGGKRVNIYVTSERTAHATSETGDPLDAPVILWVGWKEIHPETTLYAPSEPQESPAASRETGVSRSTRRSTSSQP